MNHDAQTPQSDQSPQDQGPLIAPLNKSWLIKMGAIMVVMIGFAVWGYIDATKIYPERGYKASQFLEWQYLQKLAETSDLAKASVDDPAAALTDLKQRMSQGISLSAAESTRFQWLGSLKNTQLLKPEFTRIPRENPREKVTGAAERLDALQKQFTLSTGKAEAPKPLTAYDIPVQWLFVGLGFPIGFYLLGLIIKVSKQKHRFDPATQTLTLHDGTSLTPAQLEDVDKRKWHKYMVALIPAAGHPRAGQAIELDLLRHRALEDWVLAMERTRFPERAAEEEKAEESAQDDAEAPESSSQS
jgi:hypothetical protein